MKLGIPRPEGYAHILSGRGNLPGCGVWAGLVEAVAPFQVAIDLARL
ncbi:hypothetical protein [Parafrankia sp. EUN1f]|nr:hypothetical protein [Parafrankia sp. EUN1f]